jgi:hypothetical protein
MEPVTRPRRLGLPTVTRVRAGREGIPNQVEGRAVEAVREQWVVEDRWWTPKPVRRRYFELVLDDGRNVVVFRDLVSRRWFSQRG